MEKFTKQELIHHLENISLESIRNSMWGTPRWGEEEDYFELNQSIAKILKESSLPPESLFLSSKTGSTIKLISNKKEIDLLSVFRDTFSSGSCDRYCYQEKQEFCSALKTCEAFLE